MSSAEQAVEKMEIEDELVEYFIQRREEDINSLTPKSTFKINIKEHPIFQSILEEEREDFRKILRKALIKAYTTYKLDEERADLISRTNEVFSDVKIEIEIPQTIRISDIKAEKHEGRIITFPCEIFAITEPKTVTIRELFSCPECEERLRLPPSNRHQCPTCEVNLVSIRVDESETVRTVTLKDLNSSDIAVITFMADIHRELAGLIEPNQKIMVTGVFKSIPPTNRRRSNKNEILIDVINIKSLAEDKTIKPDPLTLQTYKDLAKHGKLIDKLINSYAWHIAGNSEAKLACMLYLTGGVEEELYRGRIHIGFVGDPATGKTEIAKWMLKITPNSSLTDGTGSTGVGLGVGMVKLPNGTSGMASGPLVKYRFVVVDELDKMEKDQYEMLLGIMEEGRCRRTLAGVDIDLSAYTSLIGCDNPVGGRWDLDNPEIGNNINLSAPLLSRFDLLFRFLNISNEEEDLRISRHIQKSRQSVPKDILSEEELTALFNYVRELKPKLPSESEEYIIQFYVKREKFQLGKDSISMDRRQYGALIRLSYAFAKLLFKHTVDEECVKLAIDLYKKSVASFGISLEEGGSLTESSKGLRKYTENRDQAFRRVFRELEKTAKEVYRDDLIVEMVKEKYWKHEDQANVTINILHQRGQIIEKSNGIMKLVN
jgi:replicative DNA helicase Mcm